MLRQSVEFALRALVAVVDQRSVGTATRERHDERRDHEVGRLAFTHGPADEGLIEEVADAGQEQLAVEAVELRDVRDPPLVGSRRAEVALEQVGGVSSVGLAASPLLATVHAHESVSDHDPCHAVSPDPVTAVTQLPENPWCPVGVSREDVYVLDLTQERVVVPRSLTGLIVQPRVVGRAGQVYYATQVADGVLGLVVVDEAAAGHRSVSFAK